MPAECHERAIGVLEPNVSPADVASLGEPIRVADAEGPLPRSARYRRRIGMRPLVVRCHLGLGKIYRSMGTREQAQEHLTAATTMYREMEMTYWLERVEAAAEDVA